MPSFSETKIFSYSAHQIHALVMDIEKYPEFLPWCRQAKIIKRDAGGIVIADLLINFKNFFEKYRSEVTHKKQDEDYFIETRAIEGPFKSFSSRWKINELAQNKCEVEFFIEFQFNSFILEKMIGGIFEKAALKMMKSFESRAQELFAK